jgi:hypothetical protein
MCDAHHRHPTAQQEKNGNVIGAISRIMTALIGKLSPYL